MVGIKICGISDQVNYDAASSADMIGFVFYPPSPRSVHPEQVSNIVCNGQSDASHVGVFVDETPTNIAQIVATAQLDKVQLHGHETIAYIEELKRLLPSHIDIIKALRISDSDDVAGALSFAPYVSMLLFDAKPPKHAHLPGGNGARFDWNLLNNRIFSIPWLLAGGIGDHNAAEAVSSTKAPFLDVSSSVETAPGIKNPERIRHIIALTRSF